MLTTQLRLLLIALRAYAWLTPQARQVDRGDGDAATRARALRYLPLAGLAVAVPAAVVYALAALWLPHAVAVLAAMLVSMRLTGVVHERGMAAWFDFLDAAPEAPGAAAAGPAGGGAVRAGVPAVIALALAMLVRLETLSSIDPSWIAVSMICAAAWSRGCAVLVASTLGRTRPALGDAFVAVVLAGAPVAAAAAWTESARVFGTAAALALLAAGLIRRQTRARECVGPAVAPERAEPHNDGEPPPESAQRRRMDAVLGAVQVIAELAFLVGILATLAVDEDSAGPEYS